MDKVQSPKAVNGSQWQSTAVYTHPLNTINASADILNAPAVILKAPYVVLNSPYRHPQLD
ncbi:hypothetical protein [Zhongshania aquimaris]|uniref:Uncharacterized protein n=1 Tax=Zhongshania aquimaris TaxID=2857107 RepID=A0ABS6VRB5_9GAMM|nr:hypothetical protein [Zhongshania aquimaris]MBW2940854.1 hypothetical protein [Zhongshania aquimaris]